MGHASQWLNSVRTVAPTATSDTPIAEPSCGRVCSDLQRLLESVAPGDFVSAEAVPEAVGESSREAAVVRA